MLSSVLVPGIQIDKYVTFLCISDLELQCKLLAKLSSKCEKKNHCHKSKVFCTYGTVALWFPIQLFNFKECRTTDLQLCYDIIISSHLKLVSQVSNVAHGSFVIYLITFYWINLKTMFYFQVWKQCSIFQDRTLCSISKIKNFVIFPLYLIFTSLSVKNVLFFCSSGRKYRTDLAVIKQ